MDDYNTPQNCPSCDKIKTVRRDYQADQHRVFVYKGDDEIKLGHLASRNSSKYSSDEKSEINKKNNAYRYHSDEEQNAN